MPNKTLLQLREDSRRAAGLTKDADAVPDLTLNEYVNQSWHELYDLITDADDGRIFAKTTTNPIPLGRNSFKLPEDHYRLVSCDVRRGEYYTPAERADPSEMSTLAATTRDNTYDIPKYFLRWNINIGEWHIFIYPAVPEGMLSITYIPTPKELAVDGDSLSNPASWLSFVTYGAAVKMLNQLERDASAQLIELKRIGQRIEDSVNDLDVNYPAVVRDTDGRYGGSRGGWRS